MHRTTPHNKELSGPKWQECWSWEMLGWTLIECVRYVLAMRERRELNPQISKGTPFVQSLGQQCHNRAGGSGKFFSPSNHREFPLATWKNSVPGTAGQMLEKQSPHSLDTCDEIVLVQGKERGWRSQGTESPKTIKRWWGGGQGWNHSIPLHHFTGEKYRGQWKGTEPQAMWTKGMEFLERPIIPYTPTFLRTKHEWYVLLLHWTAAAQSPAKLACQPNTIINITTVSWALPMCHARHWKQNSI